MQNEPSPTTTSEDPSRIPWTAWVRPGLLALGAVAALLLVLADQLLPGVFLFVLGMFFAYWTSPLRSGPHTPLAAALAERSDEHVIIVWAPGDPMSARMQTAMRGTGSSVTWVNSYKDPDAGRLLSLHGGRDALPVVIVGRDVQSSVTIGQLLDMQQAGRDRAAAAREAEPEAPQPPSDGSGAETDAPDGDDTPGA